MTTVIKDTSVEDDIDNEGVRDFHTASGLGKMSIVNDFLSKNVDVDWSTNLGWTPLMYAVRNGHVNVSQKLIDHGANVHHKNKLGVTVLSMATASGKEEIVKMILQASTKQDFTQQDLLFPFFIAVLHGHFSIMHLFLGISKDLVNVTDKYGVSPLMLAATSDCVEVIQFLLCSGADASKKNIANNTAFDIAKSKRNETVMNILCENGSLESAFDTDCDVIGSDLIENYGWSFNKQCPQMVHSPIAAKNAYGRATNSSCTLLHSFNFSSRSENSPLAKKTFPQNILNPTSGVSFHVPVPPFSPYSETSAFIFPQISGSEDGYVCKDTQSHHMKPNGISCYQCSQGELLDNQLLNFISPKCTRESYKSKTLRKKEKMKLWWSQNSSQWLRNLFPSKWISRTQSKMASRNAPTNIMTSNYQFEKDEISSSILQRINKNSLLKIPNTQASVASVPQLLKDLNLDKYIPAFAEHEIDIDSFLLLDQTDLEELGIKLIENQEKLLQVITSMKENA